MAVSVYRHHKSNKPATKCTMSATPYIYVLFRWLGFYTQSEVNTSKGRLDCILFAPKQIFIIEFKVDESAEKALAQINEKGYAEPYRTDGRPIVKIGVNFSSEERTIEGWMVEDESV